MENVGSLRNFGERNLELNTFGNVHYILQMKLLKTSAWIVIQAIKKYAQCFFFTNVCIQSIPFWNGTQESAAYIYGQNS